MNVLIVFAHPEPKSFNGALFNTAVDTLTAAGHTVVTSDLYAMDFDPNSSRRTPISSSSSFHSGGSRSPRS